MGKIFADNFDVLFQDEAVDDRFHLYECGYEECKPSKPYEFKPLDYWVIHYCVYGQGFLSIHGRENKIQAGDIFVIPPHTVNKYYPSREKPWSYRWVGLRGSAVPKYLEECGISREANLIRNETDARLEQLFEQVYECRRAGHELKALGYVFHMLDYIQHNRRRVKQERITSGEVYYQEILKFIRQNYFNNITVTDISDKLNIDRTYIFKLFKRYLGMSPSRYIQQYRLDKAAILLRKSSMSITEAGYAVGFNSNSHFSRLFTEYFKMTPSEYRKKFLLSSPEEP